MSVEVVTKKEFEEAIAKLATKDDLREIVAQMGITIRSIVREEITKALDEKLDALIERKVEEKLKTAHITLS